MLIGYARVSTDDQRLDLQRTALREVGCERVYEDTASGAHADRPGLGQAIEMLRAGDTLVVWRLDRLARSLKNLIALSEKLDSAGVGLRSIHESIDARRWIAIFPVCIWELFQAAKVPSGGPTLRPIQFG